MPPRLTADDLHLFNEGTHYRLHEKLGAHVSDGGTDFAIWAPSAVGVSVIGDFNGWRHGATPLHVQGHSGIWIGRAPGAGDGALYKYAIATGDGRVLEKADPVGFRHEEPPRTASVVWDGHHAWGDDAWMRDRRHRNARDAAISIYELHLGSWMREHGRHGAPLDYRRLGDRLAKYCDELGFTHVELMPVMEHPFYGSWGYQVTGYFAPTARYGRPEGLMQLVDTLHQHGIGVLVDWVPAHFPTDAHGLGQLDGTHLYEHADPRRGFHPDWTSYIFNYGRHEVRSFLISSAFCWLDRFHLDGLRVDGVASMLYRDYSRQPGEWIPNEDGSNHDRDAIAFLQQLNHAVYTTFPDVVTIAEESTAWGGVSRPPPHGLGFGFKWDLGWMHDTLGYMHREPVHRRHHHDELTFRSIYQWSENYVLPLSHDEVVHGKGSLLSKMPTSGDDWQRFANLRLLFGYQWSLPGKKLLFMGGELAVWSEWRHDEVLDWDLCSHERHAGVQRWVRDLNAIYRRYPALARKDCEPGGVEWIIGDDRQNSVLVYVRKADDAPPVVIACNFTPVPREAYEIGLPSAGPWREILNSDAKDYGGSGMGNLGVVRAVAEPWRHMPAHTRIVLPPLSTVWLAAEAAR